MDDTTVRVEEEMHFPKGDFDKSLDWVNPYGIDQDEFQGSFAKQVDNIPALRLSRRDQVFDSLDSRNSSENKLQDSQSEKSSFRRIKWIVFLICLTIILIGLIAGLTIGLVLVDNPDDKRVTEFQSSNITSTTTTTTVATSTTLGLSTTTTTPEIVVTHCSETNFTSPHKVQTLDEGLVVLMDIKANEENWIIFQRRSNKTQNFNRNWQNYSNGFGSYSNSAGEDIEDFWLGLNTIHQLCNESAPCQMRIELRAEVRVASDLLCSDWYAEYDTFGVSGESDNYTLTLAGYSGDAGDAMLSPWDNNTCDLNGASFTTKDRENPWKDEDGKFYLSGWWNNNSGFVCSNLNGLWGRNGNWFDGVRWTPITDKLKQISVFPPDIVLTEMKLRHRRES